MANMRSSNISVRKICYIAVFMAMNIALSSFSVPVGGGHFYLNDIVICFAALIFDPISAFIVGGVGAFLGDFFFYPQAMFVSLVVHGLQAVAISLIVGKKNKLPKVPFAILALVVGAAINVVGYHIGRSFIYSTPEYAVLKLPFQVVQAVLGAVVAACLLYFTPLRRWINKIPKK